MQIIQFYLLLKCWKGGWIKDKRRENQITYSNKGKHRKIYAITIGNNTIDRVDKFK